MSVIVEDLQNNWADPVRAEVLQCVAAEDCRGRKGIYRSVFSYNDFWWEGPEISSLQRPESTERVPCRTHLSHQSHPEDNIRSWATHCMLFYVLMVLDRTHNIYYKQLMPLLLRGLNLPDPEIRANVIDTLLATADTEIKNPTISEHASSLVSTMLKNSIVSEQPSVVSSFCSWLMRG